MSEESKAYGQVEMGTVVSSLPVQKYKASASMNDLVTFLHEKPVFTKSHFHEALGSFLHNDVVEQLGWKPKIKYNWLIVVWDTNKDGSKIVSDGYEIKVLSIADYNGYSELRNKYKIKGDFSRKYCVQISCDNEQYQNMHFEVNENIKPPYLKDKNMKQEIKQQYQYLYPFIPHVVGREVSNEETREKLGLDKEQFESKKNVTTVQMDDDVDFDSAIQGGGGNQALNQGSNENQSDGQVSTSNDQVSTSNGQVSTKTSSNSKAKNKKKESEEVKDAKEVDNSKEEASSGSGENDGGMDDFDDFTDFDN